MHIRVGDKVRIVWVPLLNPDDYVGKVGTVVETGCEFGSISGRYTKVALPDGSKVYSIVEEDYE